jgi:lysine 2,3-aminomutase
MRITPELVKELKKYKPVYLMTHFNHPRELTAEAVTALELFVDNGIPTFNQTVLLNGINNHPAIIQALSRRLLYVRVKPYYLFQCDPSMGTDHLRTTIEDSEAIQKELWGHLSGLAMPTLSVDIPNGGGKVSLAPQYETSRNADSRSYQGWDGVQATYINAEAGRILKPLDVEMYSSEWESLKTAKTIPGGNS